jgi:hypothetical protein
MILHALALVLASAPAADVTTLPVKVVSLKFSYPYYGEPGNTCQRGNVYVHAVANSVPVVVRMVDSAGLTPGTEAVLDGVRLAGKGRDGTVVYCAGGRQGAAPPAPVQPAASTPEAAAQPPLVQAEESPPPAPAAAPAVEAPAKSGCTSRLFHVVKKPLGEKKFGPSEFDPQSALGEAEAVDCSLARSRVTNVLLIKMVKDGISTPGAVVGAEWGPGSSWQREPDAPQRRVVKVYFGDSP